jgi:hypothetical protein
LAGLRAGGHEVEEYALGARLAESRVTLEYRWRKHVRADGPLKDVRPTAADVQYAAGIGLLERALRFEPEWVVVVCAAYLHPDVLILARRAGLRLAVVFTESPYDDPEQAKVAPLFEVCFTNERRSVAALRPANPHTHYLPAGYDPATHGGGDRWDRTGDVRAHDVVFVGTGFASRTELLSCVDWTGIDLGLYGSWGHVDAGHPLAPYVRDGLVDNARVGALYRAAKVGLNLYRGAGGAPAESMNPRAYELAADGVCTVSQPRLEQAERLGDAVVTVDDPAALEEAVRPLLADPQRRRRRAQGLPERVRHDTYHDRAAQLVARLFPPSQGD